MIKYKDIVIDSIQGIVYCIEEQAAREQLTCLIQEKATKLGKVVPSFGDTDFWASVVYKSAKLEHMHMYKGCISVLFSGGNVIVDFNEKTITPSSSLDVNDLKYCLASVALTYEKVDFTELLANVDNHLVDDDCEGEWNLIYYPNWCRPIDRTLKYRVVSNENTHIIFEEYLKPMLTKKIDELRKKNFGKYHDYTPSMYFVADMGWYQMAELQVAVGSYIVEVPLQGLPFRVLCKEAFDLQYEAMGVHQ